MKKLLEENETLTQIVNDAGRPPPVHPPARKASQIYKPKFSSKNPASRPGGGFNRNFYHKSKTAS